MENYTTTELISKIDPKETEKLKKEQAKIVISNDAYAISNLISDLIKKIEQTRLSL